jgi:hypothetical protein
MLKVPNTWPLPPSLKAAEYKFQGSLFFFPVGVEVEQSGMEIGHEGGKTQHSPYSRRVSPHDIITSVSRPPEGGDSRLEVEPWIYAIVVQ